MGISFKLSKKGTRFRPLSTTTSVSQERELDDSPHAKRQINTAETLHDIDGMPISSTCSGGLALPEDEVSFTLNLFHKRYFIGKPSEELSPVLQDVKSLHPYDRASEALFSAIESGWLPGDILDDIPSKYFHGTLICEVRDYRKSIPEQGTIGFTSDGGPVVSRVQLRMSLENIVKDIPLISDDSWTYSDLMEVESRILKALRPQLCLDRTPVLDRLCHNPTNKLNLGIGRKRRLRQTPEVSVTSNNQTHGKKICIDRSLENANFKAGGSDNLQRDAAMQHVHENATIQHVSSGLPSSRPDCFRQETARPALPLLSQSKFQLAVNYTGIMHGVGSPANFMGANMNMPSPQNHMSSFNDNVPQPGKRENQDQLAPVAGIKRVKQTALGFDSIQQQQGGPQFSLSGTDLQWENPLLHQQLEVKGMQYSTMGGQRYPSQLISNMPNQESGASLYFNQQGMRYGAKEEQIDEKSADALQALTTENNSVNQQQSSMQQLSQQASMRSHLPPLTQWHNSRASTEKDMRKEDVHQKRKSVNSPRVSSGPMVQSPVSSKSGELSSGSLGGQFSAVATASALGLQKDKGTINSNAAIGAPSVTSSPSDSLQRQHQASAAGKRKANSMPKTQDMSGAGSPASVSNMNAQLNASSPSIGTAPIGDQVLLERFSKIDVVTQRYQLNVNKTKADDYPVRKPVAYSSQKVAFCLNNSRNSEDYIDPIKPLSKSIIGGSSNTFKTRVLNFLRAERMYQVVPARSQIRLIMHEKHIDGTVAVQYGDTDDSDSSSSHDCSLMLPTSDHADLLAAQFCSLMGHDGYQKIEDRAIQSRMSAPAPAVLGMMDNVAPEVKHPEVASGQPSNVSAMSNNSSMGTMNSSRNLPNSARLLAPGNSSQVLAMSQGFMPSAGMPSGSQQHEQPLIQKQPQQQQQQHQQLQLQQNQQSQMQQQQQLPLSHIRRSPSMLSTNSLLMGQNSNLQMGANPMVNKQPDQLQLQMLQQQAQQQPQQQTPLPRKMMMNLGATMGVGNMGNGIMGLGGLSNVMGMGVVRGISSPVGPMSALGNISPNQLNLGSTTNFGVGLRPGSMSVAQAPMLAKLRMAAQNRAGMYGQSGIAGMPGNSNQMLPSSVGLSMLGHALNRVNMSSLQRNATASMGPPKLSGVNFYLNPQHQLQLQQQQQQFQQQQQVHQHQHQHQQQQISSPLQQAPVGSPPVVGSPQAMVMQQQMGQQAAMSP